MDLRFDGPSGSLGVAFAILVGLAAMGYGAYSYTQQASALDSAVEVNASVTDTGVEEYSARRDTDYGPVVTFEYAYEGETYTSSNVYPGPLPREFDTREAAREQLDGYEPGDAVTAYVPAGAPADAYLERERSNKPFVVVGVGALFLAGGVRSALQG
ncbi:DUF3592 domain-containing protein [Candidatus Halobonum tyrrellensis]|uniref:DUF3592 domain-containing protein n=1 Tax=Candidatus Halobonum tyrrellensis G22 TaxID=1324957 RepID=V4HH40_9EURY|nr:DUF3592 domain-containing protein [Candidatus Halobonum tyrrellensis]ESP87169.1 hypothetical protein K933_15610 [Candidatus Halobonum tyrrellensis G22]